MAAFNSENFIAESINSILNQSFKNFELIIVDDGSTDNTVKMIEQFSDHRIRLFKNGQNKGLEYTRNKLKVLAKAPLLAVLDSDDIAHPRRIEIQYRFMNDNPEFVLCGGQARIIDTKGIVTGKMQVPIKPKNLASQLLFGNVFINSSTMFRKDAFLAIGGYRNLTLAEDYDLFVRMAEVGSVANIIKTVVDYRTHNNNISVKKIKDWDLNEKKVLSYMLSSLQIETDDELLEIYHQIVFGRLNQKNLENYFSLLRQIKEANELCHKYQSDDLSRKIYHKWYEILMDRNIKPNTLFMLMRSSLFDRREFKFKHLRKIFKKTC